MAYFVYTNFILRRISFPRHTIPQSTYNAYFLKTTALVQNQGCFPFRQSWSSHVLLAFWCLPTFAGFSLFGAFCSATLIAAQHTSHVGLSLATEKHCKTQRFFLRWLECAVLSGETHISVAGKLFPLLKIVSTSGGNYLEHWNRPALNSEHFRRLELKALCQWVSN